MRKHPNVCPECGANLDPCERCDCRTTTRERLQIIHEMQMRNQQREREFIHAVAINGNHLHAAEIRRELPQSAAICCELL